MYPCDTGSGSSQICLIAIMGICSGSCGKSFFHACWSDLMREAIRRNQTQSDAIRLAIRLAIRRNQAQSDSQSGAIRWSSNLRGPT